MEPPTITKRWMPTSAGRTIRDPRPRPATSSSVVPTRMRRRASTASIEGGGAELGGVPGERGRRRIALIVVVGRGVERDPEAVTVLLAAREGTEAGDRVAAGAHLGERAGVLVHVIGVAAGGRGGAGERAAVLDGHIELG